MSIFASFLKKYAGEALSIASALTTVAEGLALSPKQASTVKDTIDKLENAAVSIAGSLDDLGKNAVVKISKADIQAAVKTALQPMVDKAVANAMKLIATDKSDA